MHRLNDTDDFILLVFLLCNSGSKIKTKQEVKIPCFCLWLSQAVMRRQILPYSTGGPPLRRCKTGMKTSQSLATFNSQTCQNHLESDTWSFKNKPHHIISRLKKKKKTQKSSLQTLSYTPLLKTLLTPSCGCLFCPPRS